MGDFSTHTSVSAVRRDHICDECHRTITKGSPASRLSGVWDGEFYSCINHVDCREAIVAYNQMADFDTDDWMRLDRLEDPSDFDWLRKNYPTVAERLGK